MLDQWFETEVRPRLGGDCTLVRYADDALMAFDNIVDAKRVLSVLGKRLARYGLTLHPDKTRIVDFRPQRTERARHPETDGTTFDFLGLTHVWGRSRNGRNMVRQVTAKSRFARAVAAVSDWCRKNRHRSIRDQHRRLSSMMRGHFAYYGVGGNSRRLRWFANQVARVWRKWLSPAGSSRRGPMGPLQRTAGKTPIAFSQDLPRLRRRERISLVKNRMREIRTSGSVRDGGGNVPIYSAFHLAAAAAMRPGEGRPGQRGRRCSPKKRQPSGLEAWASARRLRGTDGGYSLRKHAYGQRRNRGGRKPSVFHPAKDRRLGQHSGRGDGDAQGLAPGVEHAPPGRGLGAQMPGIGGDGPHASVRPSPSSEDRRGSANLFWKAISAMGAGKVKTT